MAALRACTGSTSALNGGQNDLGLTFEEVIGTINLAKESDCCLGLRRRLRPYFNPATPFSMAVLVLLSAAGGTGWVVAGTAAATGGAGTEGATCTAVATGGWLGPGVPTAPAACAKSPR